jgi:hypothetical protein
MGKRGLNNPEMDHKRHYTFKTNKPIYKIDIK